MKNKEVHEPYNNTPQTTKTENDLKSRGHY
jgi:hypothetical protein